MLPGRSADIVRFPAEARPRLLVIVDAEEEFDWEAPFSQANRSVKTISAQFTAQRIFQQYHLVPTYAVDYPVASQEEGYRPLLEFLQSKACEVGAQLHPWVTPPHEEEVSEKNSFTNNLPASLQQRKLACLTETIAANFGQRPILYRAGRYGAGEATPGILNQLGYKIDCSVLPGISGVFSAPSYEGAPSRPYWLASCPSILEIPVTIGDVGAASRLGHTFYDRLASRAGRLLKLPAIAARLGVIERIRLTPEGMTLEESTRLTRAMLNDDHRVFVISYHSPSLVPGHTPYVKDRSDLEKFLHWLEAYLAFFFGEVGGIASTPSDVRSWATEASGRDGRG